MVTFSGPNYVIPTQVPNPSPILKQDVSDIQSGNSLAATRRPFENPNHLALQQHQALSIPWTTQLVLTGGNQESCMALAHWGQLIFHCGNSVTQIKSQDDQNFIVPVQKRQLEDSPSRISLSTFHIYWPPFIT
ncbi:hypothetical protein O181_095122 [Austropuccinia psidii MF-1]|uniref:Uncharacterized protein n=1 Tax=Austropuccinia psidii MF-1 TaxID=1389203 RepID=A0A9Q3J4R1_9BASI|nr:hypothetical protein [Austropuccinia psidii MF-1]